MKKYIMIVMLLIVLGGCAQTPTQTEDVSLMLDYTPNTNHTGIYVAMDKGYYAENGINLDVLDTAASSVEQSVANNVTDFGISYEENVTQAFDQGIDNLTSIYGIMKENTSGFISYADKNITTPEDFADKTYCGWGTNVEQAIVKQVVADAGLSKDSISIVNGGVEFLQSNEDDCDIFWEFEGWTNKEADVQGVKYNYIPLTDLGIDFYTPVIITSKEFEEENATLVQNFISATIKGYEYAAKNPDEAAEIFLQYNPSYDETMIKKSQEFVSNYYINDNQKAGYQNDNIWEEFTNFLYDNEIVSSKDYKELYTNKYVDEYYQS